MLYCNMGPTKKTPQRGAWDDTKGASPLASARGQEEDRREHERREEESAWGNNDLYWVRGIMMIVSITNKSTGNGG